MNDIKSSLLPDLLGFFFVSVMSQQYFHMSGWLSGLRCCVQVAVSSGFVGLTPISNINLQKSLALKTLHKTDIKHTIICCNLPERFC